MEELALTVADLEMQNTEDYIKESTSTKNLSVKDTENPLSYHSILKKPKTQEPKKVIFSDPEKYSIHEISSTKFQPSSSTSAESKETSEPLEKESNGITSNETESLKMLSMLSSQGLLNQNIPQVQSAQDLRVKANSITSRLYSQKRYVQSPCEIFRQRLNSYYIRNMQRNMLSSEFEMKKPEQTLHMVSVSNSLMVVKSYNNINK